MKKARQLHPTTTAILNQVDVDTLTITNTALKTCDRETFITKRDLKDKFGLSGSALVNTVHYELKKLWGRALDREAMTSTEGVMILESVKQMNNGKVVKTYAPLAKPKAAAKKARKPRKSKAAKQQSKVLRLLKKLASDVPAGAEMAQLEAMIAAKLAA